MFSRNSIPWKFSNIMIIINRCPFFVNFFCCEILFNVALTKIGDFVCFKPPSARPEVRGTAEGYGGAYIQSCHAPSHALTTSHHWRSTDGRAGTDRTCVLVHHFWVPFVAEGVMYIAGLVRPPIRPQHELPPARLALHRMFWEHCTLSIYIM